MSNSREYQAVPGTKFGRRTTLAFLFVLFTVSYMDRRIISILIDPIRRDLHITDTQISLLLGMAFAIFYAGAGLPLGRLADIWHRGRLIGAGVAMWSAMTMMCGFSTSFSMLFVARMGVGVGEATLSPSSFSLLSDLFPKEKLARILSVYTLGVPVGSGLALLGGGWIASSIGTAGHHSVPLLGDLRSWQVVFVLLGAPGLVLALIAATFLPEPREQILRSSAREGEQGANLSVTRHLWAERRLYLPVIIGTAFIQLYTSGAVQWLPTVLQRVHGLQVQEAGTILGLSTIVLGIAGMLSAGWLTDKLIANGRLDGHLLVTIGYGLGMLICGVGGTAISMRGLAIPLIALSSFFTNATIGVVYSLMQLVTPREIRGRVVASFILTTCLFEYAIGPTAVALVTDLVFQRDNAVGLSVACIGLVSLVTGCLFLNAARKSVWSALADTNRDNAFSANEGLRSKSELEREALR